VYVLVGWSGVLTCGVAYVLMKWGGVGYVLVGWSWVLTYVVVGAGVC